MEETEDKIRTFDYSDHIALAIQVPNVGIPTVPRNRVTVKNTNEQMNTRSSDMQDQRYRQLRLLRFR